MYITYRICVYVCTPLKIKKKKKREILAKYTRAGDVYLICTHRIFGKCVSLQWLWCCIFHHLHKHIQKKINTMEIINRNNHVMHTGINSIHIFQSWIHLIVDLFFLLKKLIFFLLWIIFFGLEINKMFLNLARFFGSNFAISYRRRCDFIGSWLCMNFWMTAPPIVNVKFDTAVITLCSQAYHSYNLKIDLCMFCIMKDERKKLLCDLTLI